jgi:hypothetical protein
MKKIETLIDDNVHDKLNTITRNKAEFVRQAIDEKIARMDKPEPNNEPAKEFMSLVSKMTKMLDNNHDVLTDIKQSFMNHDAKFHLAYAKSEQQFYETMRVILRNNVFAVQAIDQEWIKDNKAAIDDFIDRSMNDIIQRIKVDMSEVINGKK